MRKSLFTNLESQFENYPFKIIFHIIIALT